MTIVRMSVRVLLLALIVASGRVGIWLGEMKDSSSVHWIWQ